MSTNAKLLDIFDGYDNAEPLAESLNNSDLELLSKKQAENKKSSQKDKKLDVPKTKKDGLIAIAKKVESAINLGLSSNNQIKLDLTFTATLANSVSGGGNKGVFVQSKNSSGDIAMNINIKRLSKLPALEVYSILYKSLYSHVYKKELENDDGLSLPSEISGSDKKDDSDNKSNKTKRKAIECLAGYLNKFLPKYFEGKFKDFTAISELVASQIISEMGEEDIEKILGVFFKLENFNDKAEKLVEEFLGESENARYNHIVGKATELMIDPNKEVVGLNYMQQYEELMSVSIKNKFKEAVNNDSKSLSDFKNFCVSYANKFMASRNLNGIEVSFDAEGELGTFYDGNPPRVNVNLKKIDSISELAMTLSHELTHAVDSCANRVKGNYNREGGGLFDGMSEDISNSGLKQNSSAYNLLKELKNYCYHVDPNERSARIGELSALKFIESMSKEPGVLKGVNLESQLTVSATKYIAYQEKTAKMVSELSDSKIAEWRSELSGFSKIPETARNMIKDRIDYLEKMIRSGLMIDAEKESIEAARKLLEQEQKAEEAKRAAQEILKNNQAQKGDE